MGSLRAAWIPRSLIVNFGPDEPDEVESERVWVGDGTAFFMRPAVELMVEEILRRSLKRGDTDSFGRAFSLFEFGDDRAVLHVSEEP